MRAAALLVLVALGGCRSTAGGDQASKIKHEIRFEGNRRVSKGELRKAIAFDVADWLENDLDEAFIDDAAFSIVLAYNGKGFPDTDVGYRIEVRPEGPLVTFDVTEGPRTKVTSVTAEVVTEAGDRPLFFEQELASFYAGPLVGLIGTRSRVYVKDAVRSIAPRIIDAYIQRGYSDVQVDEPPLVVFNDERTEASIHLRIEQGRRFLLGRVELSTDTTVPGELGDQHLRRIREMTDEEGMAFYPRLPYELRGVLFDLLANAGYPDTRVEVDVERDQVQARVNLTIKIDTGTKVTINAVRFEGNDRTRDKFMRARLQLGPGDDFDNRKLRQSVRKLYDTGLFTRVDVRLEESTAAERALVVSVEEAPSLEFHIEPGFGSYELFRLSAGVLEKNLGGAGLRLNAEGTIAVRATRAEIGLTDPWFLREDLIGNINVSYNEREEPSFTRIDTAVTTGVTKEWTRRDSTNLSYRYEDSRSVDVSVILPPVQDSSVDISSIILTQLHDRRLGILAPIGGHNVSASVEIADKAIGSELDFARTNLRLQWYRALREGTVFATSFRTGIIAPFESGEQIPLQQRYFNGGQNTVRSYRESQLGPKDPLGNPVGGETFSVFNLELRQQVYGSGLQFAAFVDAGNVSLSADDYLDFRDMGYGIGAGLRYLLPVGPLRLDAAYNPDPEPGDADYAVHFSVGMAF